MPLPITSSTTPSRKTSSEKLGEKLAIRISDILARLHQGEILDKEELAAKYGVDVRTIERDLHKRLRGIVERNNAGWQLKQAVRGSIPASKLSDYTQMIGTGRMFPDSSTNYLLEQLDEPESSRTIRVQAAPVEDLQPQSQLFTQLQNAIAKRYECSFSYGSKARRAQPYRLIHKNGVWYLAAEEDGKLKNFSIAKINALEVDTATFEARQEHIDYINAKDDVWFTSDTTEVLLRVAPEITHYFARRPLLPRQQQREDTDGSLLVTTHINHPNQLLPVVRYWLPNVRIIQPQKLHEELVEMLKQTLMRWND